MTLSCFLRNSIESGKRPTTIPLIHRTKLNFSFVLAPHSWKRDRNSKTHSKEDLLFRWCFRTLRRRRWMSSANSEFRFNYVLVSCVLPTTFNVGTVAFPNSPVGRDRGMGGTTRSDIGLAVVRGGRCTAIQMYLNETRNSLLNPFRKNINVCPTHNTTAAQKVSVSVRLCRPTLNSAKRSSLWKWKSVTSC